MSSRTSDDDSPGEPSEPPPILSPPLPARPRKNIPAPALPTSKPMHTPRSTHRPKDIHDIECEHDMEDEISQQMTASYSEISFNSGGQSPISGSDTALSLGLDQIETPLALPDHITQRPASLHYDKAQGTAKQFGPLDLDGTIHVEGNMTYFIAEDLEYKIKLSSPITKKSDNEYDDLLEEFDVIEIQQETPSFPGNSRSGTPNNLYRQILVPQIVQVDANVLADLECEAQRMATSIDNLTENLGGILHSISSITADNVDTYKDAVAKMSDAMDSNIKGMYTIIAKAEEVSHAMENVQYHAERIKEIKRLVDLFESNI